MGVTHPVDVRHLGLGLDPVHARHAGDGESTVVGPSEGGLAGCQDDFCINFGAMNCWISNNISSKTASIFDRRISIIMFS